MAVPRRRRRAAAAPVAILGVALAVAACSTAAGPLATSVPATATALPSTSAIPVSPSAADGLAQPLGDRLVAKIDVDGQPCAIAFDATSGWVTSYGRGTVDRIDLATNGVAKRVTIGGTPCGIAVGPDGRIWVADLRGQRVVAIDPSTGRVTAEIGHLAADLWDLKVGFGAVWVVDRDHAVLLRIDPAKAAVAARIPIGPMGGGLAVTTDAIWVADASDGTIRRIDPETDAATVTATVDGGAIWFADDGATRLAVGGTPGGPVAILDPSTGAIRTTVTGWIAVRDGTVVGSTAWLPDGKAQAVRLLDLAAGRITTTYALPGAFNPFVAEPAAGDVFVLDFGGTTVWRIRP